ncbi:MAG: hypothetical protein JXL20_05165 [Deltaproteobacteria bacterium]|nr:hypothetical protein [Deltaproteobacteria bacterium]
MKKQIISILLFILLAAGPCYGSSQGPNYTGTVTDTGVFWNQEDFAKADDGNACSGQLEMSGTSGYIFFSNFGFDIPESATINGIQVTMERKDGTGVIKDGIVILAYPTWDATKGSNQSDSATWTVGSYSTKTWGTTSSVWGYSAITASIVNSSTFGVTFQCYNDSIATEPIAYIDYVRMTVTYTFTGWEGDVIGVSMPAKVMGVAQGNFTKIIGK